MTLNPLAISAEGKSSKFTSLQIFDSVTFDFSLASNLSLSSVYSISCLDSSYFSIKNRVVSLCCPSMTSKKPSFSLTTKLPMK